jgi:hypothetical protein
MQRKRTITRVLTVFAGVLLVGSAHALKLEEFAALCDSVSVDGSCVEHPIIQAYVGGALDLVAALDEDTDYLAQIYCREAGEFFDVRAIIEFMLRSEEVAGDRNAMLTVIRYLEEEGGCR